MEDFHLLEAVSWLVQIGDSLNCFSVFLAPNSTSLIYITHFIVAYTAHIGTTLGL